MKSTLLPDAGSGPALGAHCLRPFATALLFLPLAAAAADWRHVEAPPTDVVQPSFYRIGPDQALWSASADGVRRSAAGATRLVHRTAYGGQLPADSVRDLRPLADGGAVLDFSAIRGGIAYCNAARVAADGRLLWRIDLALTDELCNTYAANAAGQGWLATSYGLRPVDAAGRVGAAVAAPAVLGEFGSTERPLAVLDDGSVIAASRLRNSGISRLTRFDAAGRELWGWNRSDGYKLDRVTVVGDGVAAMAPSNGNDPAEVLRWNAAGRLLWTYRLPIDTSHLPVVIASGVSELLAASGGDVYVVVGANGFQADSVLRLGPDGRVRWQTSTDCYVLSSPPVFIRTADDGVALLCQDSPQASRLLRLTRDGALSSLSLPLSRPRQLLQQGDGRLLALGDEPIHLDPVRRRTLLVDGARVTAAALDGYRDAAPGRLVGKALLADGSAFVAIAPETLQSAGTGFSVSRIGPDGRLLWRRQLDQAAARGDDGLAAGGGLVCVALNSTASETDQVDGLACVDAADGHLRWLGNYYGGGQYGLAAIAIGDDGSVRSVRSRYNEHELQRFDRDGAIQSIVNGPGQATSATFDTRGAATVTTNNGLRQYAADGSLRLQVPSTATPVSLGLQFAPIGPVIAGDDGSVWLIAPPSPGSSSARRLWAVAPDGRTRWTRDLGDGGIGHLQLHGTTLLALGPAPGAATGIGQPVQLRVERIDAIDGRTLSTDLARSRPPLSNGIAFAAAPDGDALIAIAAVDRLHLERIGADGRPGHTATLACSTLCGAPAAVRLDAAGNARAIFSVLDRELGQSAAVVAQDLAPPVTRLDQPGIAGAWWSPYANGEGITFDWLPASRTLFGAWFTYSAAGGSAASELRWYTVQANGVADAARRIELPILQTGGGVFDAGPVVAPQRVGTAQLEFHDCDKATLSYAFDASVNDGRSGTITLSRLSPATQPCVLADGSSVAGAGARPPQNGFDARLSGSWFDEATAGQGLEFTVQPGGVFFAPWFTFDPAGTADDPGRQHWLTLQGDLAQARDGKAELVLVQTLGGAFDRLPTYNANAIGSASLRVLGCDRAELDYRVDDTPAAGAFRGRRGTLRLARAGGCAP